MPWNKVTRELRSSERSGFLAHLLSLEAEDRRLRFGHTLSDDRVRDYVESIDFAKSAIFVATDQSLAIVGAAHLARDDETNGELGILVRKESRGKGTGAILLQRSIARARSWSLRVLFMNCLVENGPMMHLACKAGLNIVTTGSDAEAFLKLPKTYLRNLTVELMAEQLGLFDHAQMAYWLALRAAARSGVEHVYGNTGNG